MDMKFTTNCVFRQSFKPKHESQYLEAKGRSEVGGEEVTRNGDLKA
jgi:hypothetical protein